MCVWRPRAPGRRLCPTDLLAPGDTVTLSATDLTHILLALAALATAAHAGGQLFARLRQPPVIGEIAGGLLLGPTVLGALLPSTQAWLFTGPAVEAVLGAVYQLGLLLLMFIAGTEVRHLLARADARALSSITIAGTLLPFAAGIGYALLIGMDGLQGPKGTPAALLLVFGIAIAVTSIPVISRIMYDLGVLQTSFARLVLGVAVIEDVLLYIVLAIALGLVRGHPGGEFGVAAWLHMEPGSAVNVAYHVTATLAFFAILLSAGSALFRRIASSPYNPIARSSPVAFQLVFVMALAATCVVLGVAPMFGAFVAGIVVAASGQRESLPVIKSFSSALFVPVYFAIVGIRLDLIHNFDPLFFLSFCALACAVKSLSVYLGARLGRETRAAARNLAVAMNARGGPGIILASVAFDAGVINRSFYVALVMLALVTSLMAGAWLQRVVEKGEPLRPEPAEPDGDAAAWTSGDSRLVGAAATSP
jgi:Kef-type K+ transport system membrane component KefB